jgi:hypothetical protein
MLITDKQSEEKQAKLNEAPVELQQYEAAAETEAESRPAAMANAGAGEVGKHTKRRRKALGWALILLSATLAVAGYLQRERLMNLLSPKSSNQASSAGERTNAGHKPEMSGAIGPAPAVS